MKLCCLTESNMWTNAENVEEVFLQYEDPIHGIVVWTPTQTVMWLGARYFRGPIKKYTAQPDGSVLINRDLGGKVMSQQVAESMCVQVDNPIKPGTVYTYQ